MQLSRKPMTRWSWATAAGLSSVGRVPCFGDSTCARKFTLVNLQETRLAGRDVRQWRADAGHRRLFAKARPDPLPADDRLWGDPVRRADLREYEGKACRDRLVSPARRRYLTGALGDREAGRAGTAAARPAMARLLQARQGRRSSGQTQRSIELRRQGATGTSSRTEFPLTAAANRCAALP